MKTTCSIRKMQESDIQELSRGFISQGWPSREEILTRYFKEQESGEREVLVAEVEGALAGYITILSCAKQGPFAESIQNSQILMSLNLFKIKVLEISCWKKQKNKLGSYRIR